MDFTKTIIPLSLMASESIAHSAFCFISDGSFTGRRPLVHVTNDPGNCSPPSIEEFPSDLFNQRERRLGAVVIHFLVVCYTSWAIAIVCDDYFVPCLEIICDKMKLQSDVAGATSVSYTHLTLPTIYSV